MIKRIVNLPNLFYVLIWLCFLLPSQYDAEMKIGLRDWYAFGAVLVLVQILYLIKTGNKAKIQAAKDVTGFVYIVFLAWELLVSRLNLLPYVFIPAPENVFYVFVEDAKVMLEGF